MQQLITMGSLALGAISAACFLLMAYLYYRNEQIQKNRLKRAESDMADMMLLFQTMRDVVRQQKELARDFNQTLDSKMSSVKHILGQSLEKNERLYEKQQALTHELEEAKSQVESLQRQMGYLRDAARHGNGSNAAARLAALAEEVNRETARVRPPGPLPAPPPASRPAPRPVAEPPAESGYGDWSQELDQVVVSPLSQEEPEPEQPGFPGDDAQTARDVFRSLLDLAANGDNGGQEHGSQGGNGATVGLSPMQKRVLDYCNAGMSVADIARELGIGKGEVRLMLSLARQSRME